MENALRINDGYICGNDKHPPNVLSSGSSTVTIEGMQAGRVGDKTGCGCGVIGGSSTVIIEGMPAARLMDTTSSMGKFISASLTVTIG